MILMTQDFSYNKAEINAASLVLANINYVVGDYDMIEAMKSVPAYEPFAEDIVGLLNKLSKLLLNNNQAKKYPDVTTFAYWCRRSSIVHMKQSYQSRLCDANRFRIGRGVIFHIAPSNVAVNFAYSMAAGLLAGNANIVRLPSKEFAQVNIICAAIKEVLEGDTRLKPYVIMVKYGHDQLVTDAVSLLCDTRVIWGGNQTIHAIRKSALSPRATEICFADRYSVSIINADAYLIMVDKKAIAQKFYNDTYLNDQNACTSPKLVIWIGESIRTAQDDFWKELHAFLSTKYEMQPVQVVDKLVALYMFGATNQERFEARFVPTENDNLITRVAINRISEDLMNSSCNSGFFFEYVTNDLMDLLPICKTELQTIGLLGVPKDTINSFIKQYRPKGIDRVVPLGSTLDFDLIWDGYDLICQMSREIIVI